VTHQRGCEGTCYSSKVEHYSRRRGRGFGDEGISEMWIAIGTGDEIGYVAKDAKRRRWSKRGWRRSLMLGIIGNCWRKHGMSFIRELEG
jgi:hypothetical protein